ncbi:LuxR C-terminal-related transcriptional regulator [Burkholderia sp. JPY481]
MLVLFAAPTGLFRDGVGRLLAELATRADVRCTDYAALALLERGSIPDLLVLDGDNIREARSAVSVMRRMQPDLPIVVLLTAIDSRSVDSFLEAGVSGCVGKAESADVLLDALRQALAGHANPPPVWRAFKPGGPSPPDRTRRPPDATPHVTPGALTKRQIEVLALAARGEPNKLIARRLNITEGTVKVHLHSVYKALKVSSRGQASMTAARLEEVSDVQIHQALEDQLSVPRLLAHMTPVRAKAGETLFQKNASSDALYYVVRGTVRLTEFGVEVGPGTMVGEIGLFSPDHRRTCTARCQTECDLLSASTADAMRLYYQDPQFAMYLIHLLARRLGASDLARKAR